MQLTHHKWNKSSRTFKTEKPNQFVYESYVGQRNVLKNGLYFPYIWDSQTNELFHAESSIKFQADKQVIKYLGNVLVSSSKFFVQQEISPSVWENIPHGQPIRNIKENYPEENYCTGYLDFPDAPYALKIGIQPIWGEKVNFSFRFRAPKSGIVRFVWVNEGLTKIAVNKAYEWVWSGERFGNPNKKIGVRFKNIVWHWNYDEADQRAFVIDDSGEDAKLQIIFGPYEVQKNEWLEIFPDTWGPTGASDDCYDQAGTYSDDYNGGLYCGEYAGDSLSAGWIWPSVTASGTAGDGCKITIYNTAISDLGCIANLKAVNDDTPPAWDASHYPSNATVHAGVVAWNEGGTGTQDSPEIKTIVQERFDGSHNSGDNMAFVWLDNNSPSDDRTYFDAESGAGTAAKLTIVYTAGNGGRTTYNPRGEAHGEQQGMMLGMTYYGLGIGRG